jgi:hypothetical protein
MPDAFYADRPGVALRFGDIITGFTNCTPVVDQPQTANFHIDVAKESFFVVLSPCCSIDERIVSLVPLQKVRATFFINPFFAEDLSRINLRIPASKALPPDTWEKLSTEDRQARLNSPDGYAFNELFIYNQSDVLPKYLVRCKGGVDVETGCYMIDFRQVFRVASLTIKRGVAFPAGLKHLELSIKSRGLLRDKISYYFSRVPDEDMVE